MKRRQLLQTLRERNDHLERELLAKNQEIATLRKEREEIAYEVGGLAHALWDAELGIRENREGWAPEEAALLGALRSWREASSVSNPEQRPWMFDLLVGRIFDRFDADKDRRLSVDEFNALQRELGNASHLYDEATLQTLCERINAEWDDGRRRGRRPFAAPGVSLNGLHRIYEWLGDRALFRDAKRLGVDRVPLPPPPETVSTATTTIRQLCRFLSRLADESRRVGEEKRGKEAESLRLRASLEEHEQALELARSELDRTLSRIHELEEAVAQWRGVAQRRAHDALAARRSAQRRSRELQQQQYQEDEHKEGGDGEEVTDFPSSASPIPFSRRLFSPMRGQTKHSRLSYMEDSLPGEAAEELPFQYDTLVSQRGGPSSGTSATEMSSRRQPAARSTAARGGRGGGGRGGGDKVGVMDMFSANPLFAPRVLQAARAPLEQFMR